MTIESRINDLARFNAALERFDQLNSKDPNVEELNGVRHPRELLYAKRLTDWVLRLSPNASETLQLASRCQHLCRWEIPRNSYAATRVGYLRWRAELKQFHAKGSAEVLRALGYPETTISQVQDLNLKSHFPYDSDCQILEDALCLVFLEHQLGPLASKATDEKLIGALQKSWKKMSVAGRTYARKIALGTREKDLLARAIEGLE